MEILNYLMEQLKKKEIDNAVLSFHVNNSRQLKIADNKIVKNAIESLKDIGVFVVKNKKIFTTNYKDVVGEKGLGGEEEGLNEMKKKEIKKYVNKIMKFLEAAHPKEDYCGINDKKFRYKEIKDGYDAKVKDIDDVDYVERAMNAAFKQGVKRTNGIFEVHDAKSCFLTSNGIEVSEKKSELYMSLRSFIKKDESGHMNAVSRIAKGLNPEKVGEQSGEIAKKAKNPVTGKKGIYDVIFAPMAIAPILNSIGDSASIFSVESGMSFFSGKLNKKVGNDKISMYDDGTLANGLGSGKADMEGVPSQKTALIEKGVYKNYLHNCSTARKHDTESTGNAGLITPDPWNVVVKPGDVKLDGMIKKVKKGIYVTNVWYTRFSNYHTGDFSTIPRDGAFLIENGKITKSLKGIRVSENVLRMLKNVSAVGKNAVHLRTWEADLPVKTPEILIKNCKITTPHV